MIIRGTPLQPLLRHLERREGYPGQARRAVAATGIDGREVKAAGKQQPRVMTGPLESPQQTTDRRAIAVGILDRGQRLACGGWSEDLFEVVDDHQHRTITERATEEILHRIRQQLGCRGDALGPPVVPGLAVDRLQHLAELLEHRFGVVGVHHHDRCEVGASAGDPGRQAGLTQIPHPVNDHPRTLVIPEDPQGLLHLTPAADEPVGSRHGNPMTLRVKERSSALVLRQHALWLAFGAERATTIRTQPQSCQMPIPADVSILLVLLQ